MWEPRPVAVFFGHHRCATSWIGDVFREVSWELRLRHVSIHHPRTFQHDFQKFVEEQHIDCVAYINAEYRYAEQLRHFRAFHVVRDPRDVCVSAYFSHLYSHRMDDEWPELHERRGRLRTLTKDDGLLAEIQALKWEFDCMRDWNYAHPRILELKMEDLTADPYGQLLRAFRFVGLVDEERFCLRKRVFYSLCKGLRILERGTGGHVTFPVGPRRVPVERLLGIVWENDFAKKANGRERGQEDPMSHYRKGVPGDWKNHFTPEHTAYFKQHHGALLTQLGYERDDTWG